MGWHRQVRSWPGGPRAPAAPVQGSRTPRSTRKAFPLRGNSQEVDMLGPEAPLRATGQCPKMRPTPGRLWFPTQMGRGASFLSQAPPPLKGEQPPTSKDQEGVITVFPERVGPQMTGSAGGQSVITIIRAKVASARTGQPGHAAPSLDGAGGGPSGRQALHGGGWALRTPGSARRGGDSSGCPALPAALEADRDQPGAPLTLCLVLSLGCRCGIVTVSEPKLKTWERAPPEGLSWVWTLGRIPSGAPFPGPGAVAWLSGARLAPNLIE